jgi:putative oxidoreductase
MIVANGKTPVVESRQNKRANRKQGRLTMIDNRTAPYAALVLRLALSFFFFAHVIRKFAVIGFDPWWDGLVKQGYPGAVLGYTVAIEVVGAVLLLLGVYTRYVSLLSLPVLIAVAHFWMVRKGFWFADSGMEFPLAWVFMLIAQALLGDGAYALRVPALPWERARPAGARPLRLKRLG